MPKRMHLAAALRHENVAKQHRLAAEAFERGDQRATARISLKAMELSEKANKASKDAHNKTQKHPWILI